MGKQIQQHKNNVDKLYALEQELIDLVFKTKDEGLINKFMEWSDLRSLCNE